MSPFFKHALLHILFVLCLLSQAPAQQYHFHHFNMKEVLPSQFIFCTYEDHKGYTWFLTGRGITRFDGKKSWIVGPADGYREGGAYHVAEDHQGRLWFVSKNFRVYVYQNDSFCQVRSNIKLSWVSIDKNGLVTATGRDGGIYTVNSDLTIKPMMKTAHGELVYDFVALDRHTFMVATNLSVWLKSQNKNQRLLVARTYDNFVIPRVFRTERGVFLTNAEAIYEYKNNRITLFHRLHDKEVYDLKFDKYRQCYWVGTTNGLLKLDTNGILITQPRFNFTKSVSSVCIREDRSIWICTSLEGLYIMNPEVVHYSKESGLNEANIRYVKKESDNLYFFSTNDLFYRLTKNGVIKERLPIRSDSGAYRLLNTVETISDSALFIMSHKNMWVKKGKLYTHSQPSGQMAAAGNGGKGMILYCFGGYALDDCDHVKITKKEQEKLVEELKEKNNALEIHRPILFDGDTAYFVSAQGLVRTFHKKDRFLYEEIKLKGVVTQVIADNGLLIVATESNGIYMMSGRDTVLLNTSNSLLSDYCSNIYLRRPYLWATTNNGLFRINLNDKKITNYTANDYLISNEVNSLEFYHDSVYVATVGGVSIFPENKQLPVMPPPVYLEKIFVNNKETELAQSYMFDYLSNNISLLFCSPGYRSASYNKFRLIINGNNRIDTTYYKEGNVQLFALMPGSYELTADVMNIDGVWSNKPVKLFVTITPPFWKTWWFITLVVVILMSVAAYVVWISVKRQKEIQDYTRRLAESELKSLRLYMNPHFLFNSLTSLQSFVLTQKTGEANSFITKFSRLIRSVMTYSIKGELKLKEELELLKGYLELESVRFSTEFEYEISCDHNIDTEETVIPSLIIQPFIENAIKYGVTGITGRRCYIHVHFFMEKNNLYCTIADNGKGRKAAKQQDKIHISSGIKFTEERIKLLIKEKSLPVLTITDTSNDEAMPGTTVKVLVPVLNLTDL